MNRSPKNKVSDEDQRDSSDLPEEPPGSDKPANSSDASWQRDIEKHDYYYDDSHGYEVYNPDEDEENDEN